MIVVTIKKLSLEVKGHANFDKHGKDIVCAGISSIICSSAEIWNTNAHIKINQSKSGYILFDFSDVNLENNVQFKHEYYFLLNQLKILMKYYPDYIKINTTDFF